MQTCKCSMATSRASDRCSPQPQCDFVLANRNGGQHRKLGEIMSKLVLDATGKYIHPARYRQIVETESLNQLTCEEQRFGRKTRNTVLPLSKFSTNRGSRAVNLTGAYKRFKETRVQRWMRLNRRGSVVQLLAQHCQLKLWKGQACLHPKRL